MIKFNLKKTKVSVSMSNPQAEHTALGGSFLGKSLLTAEVGGFLGDLSELDSSFFVKFTIKLLLIGSIPLGLKVYEIHNINLLETEKSRVESILSAKQGESAALKANIESFDYLKKQKEEYVNKKNLLEELASSRLVIPQFLDRVQDVIPESTWLTKISVSKKGDTNQITIEGESLDEESVNNFLVSLQDIVQKNTIQFNTTDMKETGRLIRVKFNIKADL